MSPHEPGQPVESSDVKGAPTLVVGLSLVILMALLAILVWTLFSSYLRAQKKDYQTFSIEDFPLPRDPAARRLIGVHILASSRLSRRDGGEHAARRPAHLFSPEIDASNGTPSDSAPSGPPAGHSINSRRTTRTPIPLGSWKTAGRT